MFGTPGVDPMQCPHCGAENKPQALVCGACHGQILPVQTVQQMEGDATGGVIPYKNPKALLAYYLGILSGLPLIGLPIGVAAFILGFLGLRDRNRNPVIKGSVHAGIGIGCGCVFSLLWTVVLVGIMFAILAES
jgi:hypothetical protein